MKPIKVWGLLRWMAGEGNSAGLRGDSGTGLSICAFSLMHALAIPLARAEENLLELGLADLGAVQFQHALTLTQTPISQAPGTTTVITRQDIERSGARNLDELLDIFVPSFQYMFKPEGYQAGLRGIISDRNNKLLITVNGRTMNILASDGGAVTERWFSMLGDIRKITVVTGAGSVIYGPGAIAGVINIETLDHQSSDGLHLSARQGVGESFTTGELDYSHSFDNGVGLFAYYGLDQYYGANGKNSPLTIGHGFIFQGSPELHQAGHTLSIDIPDSNGAFNNQLRHKAHLQLNGENWEFWTRYTRSGLAIAADQHFYRFIPVENLRNTGTANQQWTVFGKYHQVLTDNFRLDYSLSYQDSDIRIDVAQEYRSGNRRWNERQYFARVMAQGDISRTHQFSFGIEYRNNDFGGKSRLLPSRPSRIFGLTPGTEWSSDLLSLLGEYQWQSGTRWLGIAGLRADKHRYMPMMISPRLALIHTSADQRSTWKGIYSHSVRSADDADLYRADGRLDYDLDVETLDQLEFDLDQRWSDRWESGLTLFVNHHNVIAFSRQTFNNDALGKVDTWGLEFRFRYNSGDIDFQLSHSYVKLIDFDLDLSLDIQNVSAQPYGYGDDLANWSNHATKLWLNWRLTPQVDWNTSLRIYWGWPGARDMADYNKEVLGDRPNAAPWVEGSSEAFGKSLFLNTGIRIHPFEDLSISLTGYNLLGFFDRDFNKKNYFQRSSQYRDLSPALALKLDWRFY